MPDFVFLENHSVYSLCEGTLFISDLTAYAKAHGFKYLSICDTNGFYGIVRFVENCKEKGLIPIIASRVRGALFNGILIARSMKGYSKICHFISRVHLDPDYDLKSELSCRDDDDYYIITKEKDFLELKNPNVYAEVNILTKNYFETYRFAKERNIKPALIYPVYFERQEDYNPHRILRAIYHNKKLSALNSDEVQCADAHFVPVDKVVSKFAYMSDAVHNTVEIAENSTFDFQIGKAIFPKYSNNSLEQLRKMCLANINKRYDAPKKEIIDRLNKELRIIRNKGFADYFLVVQDIVKQTGYTCGRGSAAASLVAYLLFITHVDPIAHDLFFERFINDARNDPPDIDVDFPWDTRDEIIRYIFERYSPDHVAMVSNHITFSVRSSVREVAKVYGIPGDEINQIIKNIGYYYNRNIDDFQNYAKNKTNAEEWRHIYEDAVRINGIIRHMSVHCGGVVITPKPIRYYIPVQEAAKGVNIIQLEKDQAKDFGFVKIDILGNRSLAVVRDALQLLNKNYGIEITYERLNPLNDKKTIDMLAGGDTIGVFYVESPAMRQLQKKARKGDYKHLVIHSSMIRPAANRWINEYIERLRGKPYKPLLPEMKDILTETYGVMCYQEDITKIAIIVADFSISEAEELRKIVSKKNRQKRKIELKDKLYNNLINKNIDIKIIDELWDMIESFSGYSFCKPHSASYALLSFKACYLKAHYPAEFMGAVLKNQGGFYTSLAYISEARRMNLKIIPPDINSSRNEYFGYQDRVYIGFMQIKHLSSNIVKVLIDEREKNGEYIGLMDFIERTDAKLKDTVILIKAGCFRNSGQYNQPQLLFMAHKRLAEKGSHFETGLFADMKPQKAIRPPPMRDITYEQRLKQELEIYDAFISIHPMAYYRNKIREKGIIPAKDLSNHKEQYVKVAGILITSKTVMTKEDELMKFISFEDETAIFETVFFPKIYKKFALMLSYQRPYILRGRVDVEFDTIIFNVRDIRCV